MIHIILAAQDSGLSTLSSTGLVLLIGCVGFVLLLCGFCFYRLLRASTPSDHHHVPLDIDTRDRDGS